MVTKCHHPGVEGVGGRRMRTKHEKYCPGMLLVLVQGMTNLPNALRPISVYCRVFEVALRRLSVA